MDFNNKVMETLTAITENNEEDKQDLANLKQSLIDGTFNVKYLTWAIMATNDENGNRIIDTYATIERLTQVLEALTQEISDRKAADDLEKNERKEETSAIINSVNQEISDRTNAVSVLNNLLTAETENRTSEDEKVLQYAQSVNEALGNAKTDLQGKIDSEAQTRLTSDNEIKASITSKEDSLKALINSVKNELNGYITTLNNRVNNLPTNYVFDTYESMKNDLLNASNTKYKVGDTLFIKEVNKPDYWVSAILSTKGTYGYYELSEQESKVDLSNYVKISELSREAIEEKFLETVENGTKSFAARSFTATNRNSGIDVNNYVEYGYDGVSFRKNGVKYPIAFPQKQGILALTDDIPQSLKNPFALTINGKVYDGSSAVEVITETITEHDFVRFWHAGIQIQNDGSQHVLRFSDFDTELEEFSPHISCQYDGPQYYWVWKFPQISGTFAMESQIPTKLSQLTNDGNYQTNTSDLKDNTTTFTTASTRSNVASGEKLSVSFGKISKYFNDLKAIAFSGDRADIGLGNVDNTSDANKPVSNATQQALNLKANASDVYTKSETDNKINEPLYNLGHYDTITANSDGTYTITRQTGYVDLGSFDWGVANLNAYNGQCTQMHINLQNNSTDENSFVSNILIPDTNWTPTLYHAKISSNQIFFNIPLQTSIDNAIAYTLNLGIQIQYKLATATTEKVEKNHYARYNQTFILEHNKSEAERSANLLTDNVFADEKAIKNITYTANGSIITINTTDTNDPYIYFKNCFTLDKKTTITLSLDNYNNIEMCGIVINGSSTFIAQDVKPITLTLSAGTYGLGFETNDVGSNTYKVMLNEGSVALPYQPYNQNKHITNNEALFLKTESDRSANLWKNGIINVSSNNQTWASFFSNLELKGHTTYTLTYVFSNTGNAINYLSISDGSKDIATTNNGRVTFTTGNAGTYDFYYHASRAEATTGTSTYKNIMLNEGSIPLPYQPYEGKVVHEKELGGYAKSIYSISQLYRHDIEFDILSGDGIKCTFWSTSNAKITNFSQIPYLAFSNIQVKNITNEKILNVVQWNSDGFIFYESDGTSTLIGDGYDRVTAYYINDVLQS